MADWVPRPVSHSVYLFGWSGEFRRAEEIASLLGVQPPDRRWFAGGWKLLETWRDAPADSSQLQGAVDELVHRVVSIGPRLQQLTESGRLSSTFSVSSYIDRDALKVWDGYGTELVPDRGPEDLMRLKDLLGPDEEDRWTLSVDQLASLAELGVKVSVSDAWWE